MNGGASRSWYDALVRAGRPTLSLLLLVALTGCSRAPASAEPAPGASPGEHAPRHVEPRKRGLPDLPASGDLSEVASWCGRHDRACVVYVPTPQKVVDRMLVVAELQSSDVLYDLGCGDGRIVVTAAKRYGVHAVGFDIDPERVREAQENVRRAGVGDLVTIEQGDVFGVDLRPASVVTVYLTPRLNKRLVPQLEKVAPGTRIVSHDFEIEGAIPDGKWTMKAAFFGYRGERYDEAVPEDAAHYEQVEHKVWLWVAPVRWGVDRDR